MPAMDAIIGPGKTKGGAGGAGAGGAADKGKGKKDDKLTSSTGGSAANAGGGRKVLPSFSHSIVFQFRRILGLSIVGGMCVGRWRWWWWWWWWWCG
jgi:hypothetical protein